MRLASLAALLCLSAASPPVAFPASWPLNEFVSWEPQWGDRTIQVSGLTLRVEVKHCGADRPSSEGCADASPYLVVKAAGSGMRPVTIHGSPGVAADLRIGVLGPDRRRPSIILISEDGGSSGCVQIDIAAAEAKGYRSFRLGPEPADKGTICGRAVDPQHLRWPSDLTGHGRSEFLFMPQMFACDLTSCAGGWQVPQVIALDSGAGSDVSADPALAPMYRANMARALYACQHQVVEAQGPCAGFAYDAQRLGILDRAWPVIDVQIRRGCRVEHESPCADVDRIPPDLHKRLVEELDGVEPMNRTAD